MTAYNEHTIKLTASVSLSLDPDTGLWTVIDVDLPQDIEEGDVFTAELMYHLDEAR